MIKFVTILIHFLWVVVLTIITQVGGIVWIITVLIINKLKFRNTFFVHALSFIVLYISISVFIIPPLAKINGRVPLPCSKSGVLVPNTYLTTLLNRHYVVPRAKRELFDVASKIQSTEPNFKVVYLDANFPFIDGFPLLPHLSHNDGKKVDLSFIYEENGALTNKKPSRTGYGVFVEEEIEGRSMTKSCKNSGYWQYDYNQYFTLGTNDKLSFSRAATAQLVHLLSKQRSTRMILLEPYLKSSLGLSNLDNIRFQGCHSVRHDDHIHWEIK